MDEQNKMRLYRAFENNGGVILDVVPHNGSDPYTVTVMNYEEALRDIEGLMVENEVYF